MAEKKPTHAVISRQMVEELVNSSGDQIVSGYFRYKKIRSCKGYKEARRKAAYRLSEVKGGRMTPEGSCYVQIAFHRTILILPILCLLILMYSNLVTIKGLTRKPHTFLPDSVLEELTSSEYGSVPYMQVPGFKDMEFTDQSHTVRLENPKDNLYRLKFQVLIQDQMVAESELLTPGTLSEVDFYQLLKPGYYEVTIKATGYSLTSQEEFNSVVQNITIKVE